MPRPAARKDGVPRKINHPVRFAEDEYEQLKQKAYKARISVSEFIRRAATRRKVVEPPPPPQLNWKIYEELGRIGNNLNQLVKGLNQAVKQGQDVKLDPENVQEIVSKLSQLLRETQMQLLETGAEEDDDN